MKKKKQLEYDQWVQGIRSYAESYPGLLNVVKFPMHGDIDKIEPNGDLTFIIILTFECYDNLVSFCQDPERSAPALHLGLL